MTGREFITREEAQQLIEQAAERGARRALQDVGIDAESDWQAHQADMRYLRQLREGADKVRQWGWRALITAVVSGVLWILWQGFRTAVKSKTGL